MEASLTPEIKRKPINPSFERILRRLFTDPSIVLVGSDIAGGTTPWKTGKTDFSLMLSEQTQELGLTHEVAANIDTEGYYKQITDLETLTYWLHRNDKKKLYILDEANIHLPSRRAMSNKSVDIIQVFPEISKARAKLIVVGQDLGSLDSELRKTGWVRGRFLKVDLKTVYIVSGRDSWVFHDIPRTAIPFDPYKTAPFTVHATNSPIIDDEDISKLYEYANGKTWKQLGFIYHEEQRRFLRTQLKRLIEKASHVT